MTLPINIPKSAYGVLQRDEFDTTIEEVAEQVRRLGYAILNSGLSSFELEKIQSEFEHTRKEYIKHRGEARLCSLNEINTIRAPLSHGGPSFMQLAMNPSLLLLLEQLIAGKFILNQQNGIINPPRETYNQAAWHRDLPYQHFVSNKPLAINALFCVDDFTQDNGATFVLPASHKALGFPSQQYIENNATQVEARAGQFIILDCMMYHAGGDNRTDFERRAVNHVYTIPYFKQQIQLPDIISESGLTSQQRELLGFGYEVPTSIDQYLASREQ